MTMRTALASDFASWRRSARALLAVAAPPDEIQWSRSATVFGAPEEFADEVPVLHVPRRLVELLEKSACHADPSRWALMYRVLWRVVQGGEPNLLEDAADPDVIRLRAMAKAVDREVHRAHAFVRFQESRDGAGAAIYSAWFEPEHDVLRLAAPFFRDRFANMRWVIATPTGAARWDGRELAISDEPMSRPAGTGDDFEDLWRTYYSSVFNPARLNARALSHHVPKRYWRDMPEMQAIPELTRARPVLAPPVEDAPRWSQSIAVEPAALPELQRCRRCPLWEHATQAVGGVGPEAARIMLVGEQPGDEEDLKGEPFVGPAGKVLDRALAAAGIDRTGVYLTNAVKHFKWEPRGKRRLHKTPAQREVEACMAWLDAEIARVNPAVIVAMGATAAYALTGRKVAIGAQRGSFQPHPSGARLLVTYHPSAVLRAAERADEVFRALHEDLDRARVQAERKAE